MDNKVKVIILRVVKILLVVLGLAAMVGFVTHFICGIRDSLYNDDIITAQDRVNGAYQFIRMALCGLITLAFIIPTIFIKIPLLPEKANSFIKGLFKKKEKPAEETKVEEPEKKKE